MTMAVAFLLLPISADVRTDIAYVEDGHPAQKLDLHLPEGDGPHPLVVWVHGGAWRAGDKRGGPFRPLLEGGFAVASINYRLTDVAPHPAQVHDCKAAVRWLRANAGRLNLKTDKIGVWGASAGGHLVAMLGTTGGVAELEGDLGNTDESSRVQAVCDWFGPSDLKSMGRQSGPDSRIDHDADDSPESLLLGKPIRDNGDLADAASPLTYVTADDPPFLIMHGDADRLVPVQQSRDLHAALERAGVDSSLRVVEGAGHGFRPQDVVPEVVRFFDRTLRQ